MTSIEEMLRQLLAGKQAPVGVQLEDPEYGLDVNRLQGELGEAEAGYNADTVDTQARYERMRRAAERQLPKDINQTRESAAARGMFNAGGRVEAEGDLNKNTADYIAQTAESQGNELNSLLRGITSRRNETQQGISLAQQNAAQRALERARNMPAPVAEEVVPQPQQPIMQQPVMQQPQSPLQRAVANNPAVRPSVAAPVKTPAQLAQERKWFEYVKFNPQNARRVVLAARAKAGGR